MKEKRTGNRLWSLEAYWRMKSVLRKAKIETLKDVHFQRFNQGFKEASKNLTYVADKNLIKYGSIYVKSWDIPELNVERAEKCNALVKHMGDDEIGVGLFLFKICGRDCAVITLSARSPEMASAKFRSMNMEKEVDGKEIDLHEWLGMLRMVLWLSEIKSATDDCINKEMELLKSSVYDTGFIPLC